MVPTDETGGSTPVDDIGADRVLRSFTELLELLPEPVKFACAQLVRNAQATPALNVRASSIERMQMEYFADSLIDHAVGTLLAAYVAEKVG